MILQGFGLIFSQAADGRRPVFDEPSQRLLSFGRGSPAEVAPVQPQQVELCCPSTYVAFSSPTAMPFLVALMAQDHISSAGLKCIQEGHEVAPLSLGWFFRGSDAAHFEGSGLHFQINLCINQGCIQRSMTEPATYGVDIYASAQQMRSGGVPEV
jgi:hypothetical protein